MWPTQNYQKDAILRQMKEYKREKRLFEDKVSELTKRSVYHDDHLRAIDAWFSQVRSCAFSWFPDTRC